MMYHHNQNRQGLIFDSQQSSAELLRPLNPDGPVVPPLRRHHGPPSNGESPLQRPRPPEVGVAHDPWTRRVSQRASLIFSNLTRVHSYGEKYDDRLGGRKYRF